MNDRTDRADRPSSFTAPIGTATRGVLELVNGSSNLTLHAAPPEGYRDVPVLAAGRFSGRSPDVRVDDDGRVRITYRRSICDVAFDWRSVRADVTLTPELPWDVLVRGGVSGFDADLRGVRLSSLEIAGGVSDARLRLGRPTGVVRVFVLGGVERFELERPSDVPVQVVVNGGATALAVDTLRLGAVGGHFEYATPGFGAAGIGGYVVEVLGGVSSLKVGIEPPATPAAVEPLTPFAVGA